METIILLMIWGTMLAAYLQPTKPQPTETETPLPEKLIDLSREHTVATVTAILWAHSDRGNGIGMDETSQLAIRVVEAAKRAVTSTT